MLYAILKLPAKLAFHFYCRRLRINQPEWLKQRGPLLLSANHPNSFLDAIVIATLFQRPVYSLVRGDVYTNSFYTFLLNALRMMPVYRISEGAENLAENYRTFEKCIELFKQDAIVLIFSEGGTQNKMHLRPLKKGTARLALTAWNQGLPLKVLPVGISYSSFRNFGKTISINFGNAIETPDSLAPSDGKSILAFNNLLTAELKPLVYEDVDNNGKAYTKFFGNKPESIFKILLALPAALGWLLIAPLYFPLRTLVRKKWNNDHYDSILVATMFALFPFYLILLAIITYLFLPSGWWLALIALTPFFGWALLKVKK